MSQSLLTRLWESYQISSVELVLFLVLCDHVLKQLLSLVYDSVFHHTFIVLTYHFFLYIKSCSLVCPILWLIIHNFSSKYCCYRDAYKDSLSVTTFLESFRQGICLTLSTIITVSCSPNYPCKSWKCTDCYWIKSLCLVQFVFLYMNSIKILRKIKLVQLHHLLHLIEEIISSLRKTLLNLF